MRVETSFFSCRIFWYSGTGNSFLVAEKIARKFSSEGFSTTLIQIKEGLVPEFPSEAIIGFVFPVAVAGTYPFIWDFFSRFPPGKNKVFMADTLGGYSGGIKGPLAKCLRAKGFSPVGAAEIIMPENFPPGRELSPKILSRVDPGIAAAERFVEELLSGMAKWDDIPYLSGILGLVCRFKAPWQTMRRIFSLKIVPEKCIKCGLCIKLCPVGNFLPSSSGVPITLKKCQTCMRCIAYCPAKAIITRHGKGQSYKAVNVENLLSDKLIF